MNKMRETDLKDKRGEIVISPGLKIRHKESQFEYTVDSIVKDKSGKVMILLKQPDAPRFRSKPEMKQTLIDKRKLPVIYESEPLDDDFSSYYYTPEEESPDDLIAVPVDEFEKDYEVR